MRYPNFEIMRLFLAGQVAVAHAWYTVNPNFGWDGLVMAVPSFLAVSGFLVLKSYEETGSWRIFIRKRLLRILPALLVSFALCFILLDWMTAWNSVLVWLTGGMWALPYRANGPLWSLAWEEAAYLMLAGLWALGAYKRRIYIWALLAASLCASWLCVSWLMPTPHVKVITFLAPAFFIGNLMYLYRDTLLNVPAWLPWVALYFGIQANYLPEARLFGGGVQAIMEAFTVVWVGMAGLRLQPRTTPDLSYGLYIYHMPIIMALAQYAKITSSPLMIAATFALSLPICVASWYLIEKPMLRFKNRALQYRLPPPAQPPAPPERPHPIEPIGLR